MPIDSRLPIDQFPTPTAVFEGADHVVVAASASYRRRVGGRDPIGRPLSSLVPVLGDEGFVRLADEVLRTSRFTIFAGVLPRWDEDGDGVKEEEFVDYFLQPLLDEDGEVRRVLLQIVDAGAGVQPDRDERFLAEVSAALSSSLDYDVTLHELARLAVKGMADWCAIDELAPDGTLRRVAVAHPDPAKVELAHRLQETYPPDPDAPRGVHNVLRTGVTEYLFEIPEELLRSSARDEEHLRIIEALGLRSYICVPLRARGHTLGALTLIRAERGRVFGPRDVALAEETARRASMSIDNARLYRESEESRMRTEEIAIELEQQAAELQFAQAELEMSNDELQRANQELELRAVEADEARAESEEANRAKTEFLSAMSHELRTPLNAIAGYVDVLDLGIHGPLTEAQRKDLDRVKRNQEILLGLVSDVLNFARMEAGRIDYSSETVEIEPLLRGLEEVIEPQVRSTGVGYEQVTDRAGLAALGDPDRIQQILLNLLTNAVKFTEPGGSIRVCAEGSGDAVVVRVSDTGRGIPPDKLEAIFDPFVQVDRHRTDRSQQGVGLGLAISRRLAQGMGGDLTVESIPEQGSTFTVTLPRAR